MTLTLEDVRNAKFRLAKRPNEGYLATDIDEFVDRVEASFIEMTEETQRLKAQVKAMDSDHAATGVAADPKLAEENSRLKAELETLRNRPAPAAPVAAEVRDDAELERLKSEAADLRSQLDAVQGQLQEARVQADSLRGELDVARASAKPADGEARVERIVVSTSAQASPALVRMVQLHTDQAEAVVAEAEVEAARKVSDAERRANEITMDARTKAEKIESEARVNAEQVTTDARVAAEKVTVEAKANADSVNSDADTRRRELFEALEAERDVLIAKVDHLRDFESNFRGNLTDHLMSHIDSLEKATLEPVKMPVLLGDERPADGSATPRLDALLAEGKN